MYGFGTARTSQDNRFSRWQRPTSSIDNSHDDTLSHTDDQSVDSTLTPKSGVPTKSSFSRTRSVIHVQEDGTPIASISKVDRFIRKDEHLPIDATGDSFYFPSTSELSLPGSFSASLETTAITVGVNNALIETLTLSLSSPILTLSDREMVSRLIAAIRETSFTERLEEPKPSSTAAAAVAAAVCDGSETCLIPNSDSHNEGESHNDSHVETGALQSILDASWDPPVPVSESENEAEAEASPTTSMSLITETTLDSLLDFSDHSFANDIEVKANLAPLRFDTILQPDLAVVIESEADEADEARTFTPTLASASLSLLVIDDESSTQLDGNYLSMLMTLISDGEVETEAKSMPSPLIVYPFPSLRTPGRFIDQALSVIVNNHTERPILSRLSYDETGYKITIPITNEPLQYLEIKTILL
jgi:hypothetical protein